MAGRTPSRRLELAVLNNVRWYEAMFGAHGLAHANDGRVWLSHEPPPAFHSNLVVVSPALSRSEFEGYARALDRDGTRAAWTLKDSHARFDLAAAGFELLFEAQWIWREPAPPVADAPEAHPAGHARARRLDWARVATAPELAEWESAWWGDLRNAAEGPPSRQFPDRLLASADHAFVAGRLDGRVVAGGIANASPGVVGLSNLFAAGEFAQEAWDAITAHAVAAFPGTALVGYERGADLEQARRVGFEPIGPLRVWRRLSSRSQPQAPHP